MGRESGLRAPGPGPRAEGVGVGGRAAPRGPRWARASGARVLAGGAPGGRLRPIRAGVRGRAGLAGSGSARPPFCTHTNTKSHTTFGYPFSIFLPSLLCVRVQKFSKNRGPWQCWGEETVAKGNLRLPPFPVSLPLSFSSSRFLNIPRS